jgi:hypothetical protein
MGNKGSKLPRSPQAVWPIVKSFAKRGGLRAPPAIYDPLGPIFCPIDKANIIADYVEKKFTLHDLYEYDHK